MVRLRSITRCGISVLASMTWSGATALRASLTGLLKTKDASQSSSPRSSLPLISAFWTNRPFRSASVKALSVSFSMPRNSISSEAVGKGNSTLLEMASSCRSGISGSRSMPLQSSQMRLPSGPNRACRSQTFRAATCPMQPSPNFLSRSFWIAGTGNSCTGIGDRKALASPSGTCVLSRPALCNAAT